MKQHFSQVFSRKFIKFTIALSVITGITAPDASYACTAILLPTTDGSGVYARTMEFGFPMESSALLIPRQYPLASTGADGKPGMKWKGKYAAVGMNALGVSALVDGMNEKGLVGGVLYFPGEAGYADGATSDPKKSLASWDVLTWILTNFATIDEVKAAINTVSAIDVKQPTMGITPPVHYTLSDASGASLVIEPIDGKFKVYDNPVGVATNSPTFDWHLTNLRNYLKITAINAPPLKFDGLTLEQFGQGSGLLGVPGDPTPPSRFIRATAYSLAVAKQPSGIASVKLAEHILNNFDIPKGWIQNEATAHLPLEYTQWSAFADLKNQKYYIKTYDDPVLRSIDIHNFDLDGKELLKAAFPAQLETPAISLSK